MMQSPPYGSQYEQLLARMRKHVRDQEIEAGILTLLRSASGKALKAQSVVLSRPERERLSQTIMKEVLNEVIERIDKGNNA